MMRRRPISRFLVALSIALVAAAAWTTAAAQGAEPKAAWEVNQASNPTNLIPGTSANGLTGSPQYQLIVTNVGAKAAVGGVTITDVLPSGVTANEAMFRYATIYGEGEEGIVEQEACTITGQTVICEIFERVLAGAFVKVTIPLTVSGSAEGEITNEVSVEGGHVTTTGRFPTTVSLRQPPFSFLDSPGLSAVVSDQEGGTPIAGSHPFETQVEIGVSTVASLIPGIFEPSGELRRVGLALPQGMVLNPNAAELCAMSVLTTAGSTEPPKTCPPGSQVGQAYLSFAGFPYGAAPLYDMVPPPGSAAAFGFEAGGITIVVTGGLAGNFDLTGESSELLKKFQIYHVGLAFWGVPSDPSHDPFRKGGEVGGPEGCRSGGCSIEESPAPLVTMPTSCTEPLTATATASSWIGGGIEKSVPLTEREYKSAAVTDCSQLAFEPTIESQATTNVAESPSGLEFRIHQPQDESLGGRSVASLKNATVTLPEGMTLNPSAANGLSSCSEEQMGYAPEGGKIRFRTTPQTCPNSAKVGTLSVHTPLIDESQLGSIYVAKPFDNPFGSLLAIYLAVESERTGIVAKLAGKVTPDPSTGRLTATFTENPELPLEDIDLHFFPGGRGVLTTPLICGSQTTTTTLTPWSTPEGADAHPYDSFGISANCAVSEAAAPKAANLSAGTMTPLSGDYSPFVLRISRPDGSQHITGIEATLPAGLLGKLAGVAYCPESGIAQAISREEPEQGKLEQQSPSCPSSSEVGTVQVTAGSGGSPIPVSGHAYLAGPYKGAPLSLVAIVPAVAGPFDLGTVVDRVALNVGEYDARIHAIADPLPTIRDGIPLDVRSIEVKLDRPSFTLNPTSCEAMQVEGSVSTQAGQAQAVTNRFQVGECGRLGFKPKLAISLSGQTKRTGHPALKAVVTYPKTGAYANIARAQVNLPHAEFLDQGNIGDACTKVLIAQRACPTKSIYGKAKAWTPLLEKPLEGPVYLVGGYGYKLPALVAELNGQIRVLLVGKIDTGKNGGIRNTFEAVPDAPVERFVLEMKGGKKYGLLENSQNLCLKVQKAGAAFKAQNGKVLNLSTKIKNTCKKGKKRPKHH